MWLLITSLICWVVWEERNGRTFEDDSGVDRIVIDAILARIYDLLFVKRERPSFHTWIFD